MSGFTIAKLVVIVIMLIGIFSFVGVSTTTTTTPTVTVISHFPPNTVNVTSIVVSARAGDCGLNGITPGGFSISAFATYTTTWFLPAGSGTIPCRVSTASTNTTGFSVGGNFPLYVTVDNTPLILNISTPGSFDGVLNLTFG